MLCLIYQPYNTLRDNVMGAWTDIRAESVRTGQIGVLDLKEGSTFLVKTLHQFPCVAKTGLHGRACWLAV